MVQVHLPKEIYVRLQGGSAGTCHGVLFGEQWANNVLIKGFRMLPGAAHGDAVDALVSHLEHAVDGCNVLGWFCSTDLATDNLDRADELAERYFDSCYRALARQLVIKWREEEHSQDCVHEEAQLMMARQLRAKAKTVLGLGILVLRTEAREPRGGELLKWDLQAFARPLVESEASKMVEEAQVELAGESKLESAVPIELTHPSAITEQVVFIPAEPTESDQQQPRKRKKRKIRDGKSVRAQPLNVLCGMSSDLFLQAQTARAHLDSSKWEQQMMEQITGGLQVDEVLQLDKSIKAKNELIQNLLRKSSDVRAEYSQDVHESRVMASAIRHLEKQLLQDDEKKLQDDDSQSRSF